MNCSENGDVASISCCTQNNFFLQNGISKRITQKLSEGVLQNYIPFVRGGGFGVTGEICRASDVANCRTEFQLDLGKWGVYNFPPVGKGWFDMIYLDDGESNLLSRSKG